MLFIIFQNVLKYHTRKEQLHSHWNVEKPDVILLNSTSILDSEKPISHSSYHAIYSPRGHSNGSAILVNKHIRYKILNCFTDKYFLAIKISSKEGDVIVSTHYCPFKKTKQNSTLPIQDFNKLLDFNLPMYFLGDLNARHPVFGHSSANTRGKSLTDLCTQRKELRYLGPSFNTFIRGKSTSKPDIIFTNNHTASFNTYIEGGPLLGSDHRAIHLKASLSPITIKINPIYMHAKADIDAYKAQLEKFRAPNLMHKPFQALDEAWEKAFSAIKEAAKIAIPLKSNFIYKNAIAPSHQTKTLAACHSNITNLLFQNPNPNLQKTAENTLQQLKESWNNDLDDYYAALITKVETTHKADPTAFFKAIDKLRGNFAPPMTNIQKPNGGLVSEPIEVLEVLKEVWEDVYRPNPPEPDAEDWAEDCEGWYDEQQDLIRPHDTIDLNLLDINKPMIAPFDKIDVEFAIDSLKKNTPGQSGIDKWMIKHLPSSFIKQLIYLFNATLASGYMPLLFKSAVTIFIPKDGDSSNPKNYRPIALLEILAKVYETVIYRRLKWHLEDNGLLDEAQFGFRPGRSTHHVLNILLNYIQTNKRRGRDVLLVCKDVEKAFDTVWKEGLIYKLFTTDSLGIPDLLRKSLASYLTDRTIRIKHANHISAPFTPKAGVPQGSVLAPLLYIIYLNDRPKTLRGNDNPNTETLNIFYADDNNMAISGGALNLFANARKEIDHMAQWETKWRIKINPKKSKILIFGPNRVKLYNKAKNNPFYLTTKNNKKAAPAAIVNTHTVLGIKIDTRLSFTQCLKELKRSINRTRKSFLRCIALGNNLRLFIYKCYILPKLLYHYPIFNYLSIRQRYAFQASQNQCIYHFIYTHDEIGLTRAEEVHARTGLEALNILCHQRCKNFYKKLQIEHPKWHNIMCQWHAPPTRNVKMKKYNRDKTSMDWATNAMRRPSYVWWR